MRNARLLAVSPSMHCAGLGVCSGGCLLHGGCFCCGAGGLLWGGVCSQGGLLSQHALRQTPPVDRQTLVTRLHSSRMHTSRSLTVCWSLLPRGEVSAPRGVSAPWGVSRGGVCSQGGVCLLWGVCSPLPPVNRMTGVKILPWPQLRCGR